MANSQLPQDQSWNWGKKYKVVIEGIILTFTSKRIKPTSFMLGVDRYK